MAAIKLARPTTGTMNVTTASGTVQPKTIPAPIKVPKAEDAFDNQEETDSVNVLPKIRDFNVSITSTLGVGAGDTQVFIFNTSSNLFNNLVTDNGSGAGSISYTWSDGYNGNIISSVMARARHSVGAIIYGYSITATNPATGAYLPTAIGILDPVWYIATFGANKTPMEQISATGWTRKDTAPGIQVIRGTINLSEWTQHSVIIYGNVGITCNLLFTYYTESKFPQ